MKIEELILKGLRRTYRVIRRPIFPDYSWPTDEEWETTNLLLTELFSKKESCLVGRIGTSEGAVILNYSTVHSKDSYIKKCLNYITDNTRLPFWDTGKPFKELCYNAGFFSDKFSISEVERFCRLYLEIIPEMNVCGRFSYYERFLPFSKACAKVQLESLYPFFAKKNRPWMHLFEGKRVLVVHPFKQSIVRQYNENRTKLFKSPDILPDFQLEVIQSVQSIAGEKTRFKDWFEALDYMKEEISKKEFDLLITGCGAYGLPLAAFGKELGKKAIHLGGGTQLLFGIKGRRWEGKYHGDDTRFADLFNEYWIYPSKDETPKYSKNIEGGCYW